MLDPDGRGMKDVNTKTKGGWQAEGDEGLTATHVEPVVKMFETRQQCADGARRLLVGKSANARESALIN
jgi:hypothetical protein